jgi:hypothetical protein
MDNFGSKIKVLSRDVKCRVYHDGRVSLRLIEVCSNPETSKQFTQQYYLQDDGSWFLSDGEPLFLHGVERVVEMSFDPADWSFPK